LVDSLFSSIHMQPDTMGMNPFFFQPGIFVHTGFL
jgi:hypothetical protein